MTCTRCGLRIRLRAPYLTVKHCPRCIAHARTAQPMQLTDGPLVWGKQGEDGQSVGTSGRPGPEDRTSSTS